MEIKVLFVCMGNICRSPAAEGVMKKLVSQAGLHQRIFVDSAGTSAYHSGEAADGRMSHHAKQRGYSLDSIARGFDPRVDFEQFHYIITMDNANYRNVRSLDKKNRFDHKVIKMIEFCTDHDVVEVPDPYYGGDEGFELVLDIVEDGCRNLLLKLQRDLGLL